MKPAAAIAGAGLLGAAMTGAVAVEKSPRLMIQAEKYVVREFNVVYRRASKVLGLSETRVTQGLAERPTGEIARAARIEAQAVTQQSHSYGAGREALYLYEQAQPRIAERLAATPPKSVEEVNKVLEESMIDEGKRRGIDFTLFSGKLKSDKVYEIGDHTLRLGDVPVWSILSFGAKAAAPAAVALVACPAADLEKCIANYTAAYYKGMMEGLAHAADGTSPPQK